MTEAEWLACRAPIHMLRHLDFEETVRRILEVMHVTRRAAHDEPRLGRELTSIVSHIGTLSREEALELQNPPDVLDPHGPLSQAMLQDRRNQPRPVATENTEAAHDPFERPEAPVDARKLRLFACFCWRNYWTWMLDDKVKRCIEAAEGFADGRVGNDGREVAEQEASAYAAGELGDEDDEDAFVRQLHSHGLEYAQWALSDSGSNMRANPPEHFALEVADPVECQLLRCIFGNPFRPVQLDQAWFAWNDGTVRKMAQAIYDERRFSDLPLLADALEDAGCCQADILAHCRSGTEHARGCFVVDLLLAKT